MSVSDAVAVPDAAPPARDGSLAVGLAVLVAIALVPFVFGQALAPLAMRAMLLAIAAISLDLLIGRAGLVSFGHAAFVGIGAYATGIALEEGLSNGLLIALLAVLSAAAFALVTGALALRTRGVAFIMITLAFGQMAFFTFSSLAAYGGDDGLTLWNGPDLFGTGWLSARGGLYFLVLAVLAAVWWLVARIAGSRFGRVLAAAKDNEGRVAAMGFEVNRFRLVAYVIAGAIAGLAGFLHASNAEFVSPAAAAWQHSGELIVVVVLGGTGTRNGALLGALALVGLEELLGLVVDDWRLLLGPFLVAVALFSTGGIVGAFARLRGLRR